MSKEVAIKAFQDATLKQTALLEAANINPALYERILLNALIKSPALATCTRESLYEAVYESCNWLIVPDGRQGAIVPLRIKGVVTAQFWPMVDGLITKVRQNIPGISIRSDIVYRGDKWEDQRGTEPRLVHIPNESASRGPNDIRAMYATAFMPNNAIPEFEVMYIAEILAMRKNNKGPWSTHLEQMGRVRPLKRLVKRLPVSGGFAGLMALDPDDLAGGEVIQGTAKDVTPASGTDTEKAAKGKGNAKAAKAKEPAPQAQEAQQAEQVEQVEEAQDEVQPDSENPDPAEVEDEDGEVQVVTDNKDMF